MDEKKKITGDTNLLSQFVSGNNIKSITAIVPIIHFLKATLHYVTETK